MTALAWDINRKDKWDVVFIDCVHEISWWIIDSDPLGKSAKIYWNDHSVF